VGTPTKFFGVDHWPFLENLIGEADAVGLGQGYQDSGARLEHRAARLGLSMYMLSMLSRRKCPVEPPAAAPSMRARPASPNAGQGP
jgi:hypothetical protein